MEKRCIFTRTFVSNVLVRYNLSQNIAETNNEPCLADASGQDSCVIEDEHGTI